MELLDLDGLVHSAMLLFFIFDPFASLPVFLSMTRRLQGPEVAQCADRAVMVSAVLFLIFVLVGQNLLDVFGVTAEGFRVAGGMVLLLMSVEIVFGLEFLRSGGNDVAWVILATPVLTGPGVMTTAIVLTAQHGFVSVALGGLLSLMATWFLLRNAARVVGLVGSMVIDIFSKVVGMLIMAMAVEYVFSGASEWFLAHGQSIMAI